MSRSGTTLIATILDSHPGIAMVYELLPSGLPRPAESVRLLESAIEACGQDDAKLVGRQLRDGGQTALAGFLRRAARAYAPPSKVAEILREEADAGVGDFDRLEARTALAVRVARHKAETEGARRWGFKLNAPSLRSFDPLLPEGSRYIYVLRDPRDVYASHLSRDFDRTLEQVCHAWQRYLEEFERLHATAPDRSALVRYEDLVTRGDEQVRDLCERLGIDHRPEMARFFDSKASVHEFGHANRDQLKQDFFSTSISRWSKELEPADVHEIERLCGTDMRRHGYSLLSDRLIRFPDDHAQRNRARIAARKVFGIDSYARLLDDFIDEEDEVLLHREAHGSNRPDDDERSILIVRHDVDHDLETAVRLAEWEKEYGIRSTYCILTTAWYYGELRDDGYVRNEEMMDSLLRIQELGHEINLHNNLVVLGLTTDHDPEQLLREELAYLRAGGLRIDGVSTHGDALCGQLDFRNLELFEGRTRDKSGGPRVVEHEGRSVRLGSVSLEDHHLSYDGFDLPRDIYVTDSGGRARVRFNTMGRNGHRRSDHPEIVRFRRVKGVLTHPIWWSMEKLEDDEYPTLQEMIDVVEAQREERRKRRRAEREG